MRTPSESIKSGASKPERRAVAGRGSVARVRLSLDVPADLRRRIKVVAASKDVTVTSFVERVLRREIEAEERRTAKSESSAWSALSNGSFARDWDSEVDSAYDRLR